MSYYRLKDSISMVRGHSKLLVHIILLLLLVEVVIFIEFKVVEHLKLLEKVEWQQEWIVDYKPVFETPFGWKAHEHLENEIYSRLDLVTVNRSFLLPVLRPKTSDNCEKLIKKTISMGVAKVRHAIIPFELRWPFTLNGFVRLVTGFKADSGDVKNYDEEGLERAIREHPVERKNGLIYGVATPKLEQLLKHYNAASFSILELKNVSQVTYGSPVKPTQLKADNYDFLISLAYLEDIGFGNHGERLDPNFDMMEMKKMRCLLKDGGLQFVSIPLGQDTVQWNQKRVYGRIRLPLLTAGFEILKTYYGNQILPLTPEILNNPVLTSDYYSVVLVLRKFT